MNFLRKTNTLLKFYNKANPTNVALCSQSSAVSKKFDDLVKGKKIVVFMKGTPDAPRCGFSNAVVQILKFHGVDNFESHDVLSDEELRQGIKEYSDWPTVPQVYFNGDFLGGCDIMLDMHKNGDLIEELNKIGIKSALVDKPKEDG